MCVQVGTGIFGALNSSSSLAVQEGSHVVEMSHFLSECVRRVLLDRGESTTRRGQGMRDGPLMPEMIESDQGGMAAIESEAALREAAWTVWGKRDGGQTGSVSQTWENGVSERMCEALLNAHRAGIAYAGVAHVLVVILRDLSIKARAVLDRYDTDRLSLLRHVKATGQLERNARPWTPSVDLLRYFGLVDGHPVWFRAVTAVTRRILIKQVQTSPLYYVLATEANRQAVRLDDGVVSPAHLMLAMATIEEQLALTGIRLAVGPREASRVSWRIYDRLRSSQRLTTIGVNIDRTPDTIASDRPYTQQLGPPWSIAAVDAMNRVGVRHTGQQPVGFDHLLAELIESPDVGLTQFLEHVGMNRAALAEELSAEC